jgi:hypothetical protein
MISNYDIEGSLERATYKADAQQEDRECIQDTLKKHRTLNPHGGEHMTKEDRGDIYNEAEKRSITLALRKAGVNHRIENIYETSSIEVSRTDALDEEGWCQIHSLLKQGCEGMDWQEILLDNGFSKKVDETIQRLKTLKNQANYRRRKIKLLATRHAGLTMTTEDLKRLYNPQARELPEPQHMILDEASGEMRPCLTRIENGKATRDHHQRWMGESKDEIQCLFGSLTEDEIGVNGVEIKDSAKWIRENISKGIHDYESIDEEGNKNILKHTKYLHRSSPK